MDYIAELRSESDLRSELIGLINDTLDLDSYFPAAQIEKHNIRTLDFKEQQYLTRLRCVRNFTKDFMHYLFLDQRKPDWKANNPQWQDLVELIPKSVHKMLSEGITEKNPKKLICYFDRRYDINELAQQPTIHLYINLDPSTNNYTCIFYMNIELVY